MSWLVLVILATMSISFICSLFEAIVLSTTVGEIEALKKARPRRGHRLEVIRVQIDETISAILTVNTIANCVGSLIVGAVAAHLFGDIALLFLTPVFAALLLVVSEVLPKNIGVVYRRRLQPLVVDPLWWLRWVLTPITWVCNRFIRVFVSSTPHIYGANEEIILLAERGAKQGTLSSSESSIIANALSLDEVRVNAVMTPRTVVATLRQSATIAEVFREHANLSFGRMPVVGKNLDDIVGLVRRRDLLKAKANDQDQTHVGQLMIEAQFIPETATVANALQACLKSHQKLLVVVDEFGSTAGVVTMEDVFEHLLGREIFETDDVAVDMREFARRKREKQTRPVPSKS